MTKLTATTALLSLASPAWGFAAGQADQAAAAACSATDGDACVEESDAHALLSLRASHVKQRRASTCPGSNKACEGNQCCDGIEATHNRTFPCPDADPDYHECAIDWAYCPGGEARCVGNQCCPRHMSTGGMTSPCPGADSNWDECETQMQAETGTMVAAEGDEVDGVFVPKPPAGEEAEVGTYIYKDMAETETVAAEQAEELLSLGAKRGATCPGSNRACSGNQCCEGIPETNGNSFPCPDADPDYRDCAIDWASCLDGETRCVGNECCPRIATAANMTYPCPGADPEWNGCETGLASEEGEAETGTMPVEEEALTGTMPVEQAGGCAGPQEDPNHNHDGTCCFPLYKVIGKWISNNDCTYQCEQCTADGGDTHRYCGSHCGGCHHGGDEVVPCCAGLREVNEGGRYICRH